MHLRRARALVGLLTLQAGLVAYSGARAARAFMEQSPTADETRVFTTPPVVLNTAPPPPASTATSNAMPGRFVLQEIVDPWQPGRSLNRPAQDGLGDPWRESRSAQDDPEVIDPWRSDTRVASRGAPGAAFDWDTTPPELLNPWPAAVAPSNYDLNELVDPWSTVR